MLLKIWCGVSREAQSGSWKIQGHQVVVLHLTHVQGSANLSSPGMMNFVTAVAYLFCLVLPAAFTQPWEHLLA